MVEVTVRRGTGNRQGEPIVEPLLSGSTAAARARANAELDSRGQNRETVTLEIAPQGDLRPGVLVEVWESGVKWRGIVDAVHYDIRAAQDAAGRMTVQRSCKVTVERKIG